MKKRSKRADWQSPCAEFDLLKGFCTVFARLLKLQDERDALMAQITFGGGARCLTETESRSVTE